MNSIDEPRSSPLKQILSLAGLIFTMQPTDQVGVIGGSATFGPVAYTSEFPVTPVLQWQMNIHPGLIDSWQTLTETPGYYEGTATDTLTIKAIDNYLATRTARLIRCALFYPGAAAIYTNEVNLNIPLHTNWISGFTGAAVGETGTSKAVPSSIRPVVGFGFPVPASVTYLWSHVSGPQFVCSDPTIQSPTFTANPLAAGLTQSVWKCTLTDGVRTVDTDNIYFGLIGRPAPSANNSNALQILILGNSLVVQTGTFVGPWAVAFQRNIRRTAAAVTIETPAVSPSPFTDPNASQGGSTVSVEFWVPTFANAVNSANVGNYLKDSSRQ